ncbi:hypothetical protein EV421DRAFT_1741718 [Armillaria borealis]|uniref:Uncharacterized protein n=1 Tax=Armillaria borealis TaxID=47425 RepID=A0AA39J0V3_9AGAR|nr:hypothetical protein EV421DRAFT_1741718 [Armillaria borealis]
MSGNKTKATSGLVICNYDSYKVPNTNLLPSNITSPHEMEDWEVPVSEICNWTYTLIDLFGYGNVMSFRDKAMESPLNERVHCCWPVKERFWKASEEWKILWRLVHHDPQTEPNDWEDFLHSKRDGRTHHHRASCDEPTNTIYDNMTSVSPLGVDNDGAKPVVPSASASSLA